MASRFGPALPRAMGWNGAGGCVMASQARQVNFSRTVCTTFHWRGMTSSVSVIVSPSLASLPPQHGHAAGPGITTRSRGRCSGSGARVGLRRENASTTVSLTVADASSAAAASNSSSCSSIWSSSLRPRSDDAPKRSCLSLAISSFRCATMASAPEARASASRRANCSAASAVRNVSMSFGIMSGMAIARAIESHSPVVMHDEFAANGFGYNVNQPSPVARFVAGAANRCLPAYSLAARG
jgi:hypothetical protein